MPDAPATSPLAVNWEKIVPTFKARLREPKKPARPSDGAIALAQKSYAGYQPVDDKGVAVGEVRHAMSHRFATEEQAALALDELKRAGAYTTPETTVTAFIDEDDKRAVSWRAGNKRGRR